jgi:hypothetical protein
VEQVRGRIESLVVQGVLAPAVARRDLKTLDFLEDHPDRRLPSTWGDWLDEWRRAILNTSDPGPFLILRVRLLAGEVEAKDLGQIVRRSAVVSGALCALLLFLLMGVLVLAVMAVVAGAGSGGNWRDVRSVLEILAMFARFCGLSGFVLGLVVWGLYVWEIRTLLVALKAVEDQEHKQSTAR